MSLSAAESLLSAHVLPTILFYSIFKISDTMAQKFEKLQEKEH